MATLYLIEQNTILRKSSDRLLLCQKPPVNRYSAGVRQSDIVVEWPCADIDHVMVFGNVQITTQALHHLLSRSIEVALFTLSGDLLGQLTPPCGKNIFLRVKQYEKYHDLAFRIDFSRMIVHAKIKNALDFLREYYRNHPGSMDAQKVQAMETILPKVDNCSQPQSLLGLEGTASALYFALLSGLLPLQWQFAGRSKRPPKDAANAVMSFGYTVLGNELASLLDGVGLDPALGYYHELDYGRPSLALDLLEIFRHTLVDRLMVNLFNLAILKKEDFAPVPQGGIYLSESGKRKFFIHYERLMGHYKGDVPEKTEQGKYRRILQDQVSLLVATIKEGRPFIPYSA